MINARNVVSFILVHLKIKSTQRTPKPSKSRHFRSLLMNLGSKTTNKTKAECILVEGLNKWSTFSEFLFSLQEIGHIGQMPVVIGFASFSSGTSFWSQNPVLASVPLSIQYSTLESLSKASR